MLPIPLATPGVDLPAFQPGPLDAENGWRERRVELPLTIEPGAVPPGGAVLRLEFDAGHGPCPDLRVELDGEHCGLFHPDVRRDDRAEVSRHGPIAGDVVVDMALPAAWLAPGDHVVALTTTLDAAAATGPIDAPADQPRRAREQYGHHFGSGLTWRRLTLRPPSGVGAVDTVDVELVATPLYVRRDGGQRQMLRLTVGVPAGGPWPRTATVHVGSDTHTLDLVRAGRDFGQVRVTFPVPELAGETTAAVSLDGGPAKEVTLRPGRKWTVHLIPHVHLDVGYTDLQGKVLELHSRNLDRALAVLRADPDFAFSIDGSLIVAQYLATRSGEHARRLLAALRGGRLSLNAFQSLFLSGVVSLEEAYRSAYLAAGLRDEHGVPVRYANLTDVPSYSAAVPSILAALGIDAFVGIENHHRGGNADTDAQHLASPVMWEGVDGSRVLTHFSDTYSQLRFMAGDPQTLPGGAQALTRLLARYDRPDYLPHDLPVIGTHADNEDLADGDAGFAARWNAVYAYPRIQVSTMDGYLDTVRPLADRLPVWRGDGGSYWEDGVGTGAAVTAEYRRVQAALPAAEALAALVAHTDPTYRPNRQALDAAWDSALYGCEHTWTWSHAATHPHGEQVGDQLDWKRHQVHSALRTARDELRRAQSQLGEIVTTSGPTLLVANPLSWRRDVEVEVELPARAAVKAGTEVLADDNGLRRLRLTVPDVPPFGYRALPITTMHTIAPGAEGAEAVVAGAVGTDAGTGSTGDDLWRPVPARLAAARWDVDLDPVSGAVTGLTHRPTGRPLLDAASPWRLGQVLYVLQGPAELTRPPEYPHSGQPHVHQPPPASTLLGRRPPAPAPELAVIPADMRPVGLRRTYDGWRLRTVGTAPSLPRIEVDVLLRDDADRVDVTVRLDKTAVLAKESVYVAFPFSAPDPRISYDRQQGWIDPARDHAPGACQEWFTTQYGVLVRSAPDGPAVAWTSADAPLFTVGDVVRGRWPERFEPGNGTVFSWVLNNYWPTNTPPEQSGPLLLRYAFTPLAGTDTLTAGRFGREVRAEPVCSEVTRLDKFDTTPRPLPGDRASLLDLDLPGHVHATVAEPRERAGLLIRLQDLAGRSGRVRLRHPHGAAGSARLCRADETTLTTLEVDATGRVTVELGAWQVASIILS